MVSNYAIFKVDQRPDDAQSWQIELQPWAAWGDIHIIWSYSHLFNHTVWVGEDTGAVYPVAFHASAPIGTDYLSYSNGDSYDPAVPTFEALPKVAKIKKITRSSNKPTDVYLTHAESNFKPKIDTECQVNYLSQVKVRNSKYRSPKSDRELNSPVFSDLYAPQEPTPEELAEDRRTCEHFIKCSESDCRIIGQLNFRGFSYLKNTFVNPKNPDGRWRLRCQHSRKGVGCQATCILDVNALTITDKGCLTTHRCAEYQTSTKYTSHKQNFV